MLEKLAQDRNIDRGFRAEIKPLKCSVCNITIADTDYPVYFDVEDDPHRKYPLCIDCHRDKEIEDEIAGIEREQDNQEEIRGLR
jgi:hypothetical protein